MGKEYRKKIEKEDVKDKQLHKEIDKDTENQRKVIQGDKRWKQRKNCR